MSRHLGNLRRLHQKLKVALGETDSFVLQLKNEIESLQVHESKSDFSFFTPRNRFSWESLVRQTQGTGVHSVSANTARH